VLLRLQGERVHVDTHGRDVGVVLVGLHQVEVLALTLSEPVVAVELDLGSHHGVHARQALHAGHGVAGLEHRAVEVVGVVERLLALVGVNHTRIARHERVALHDPHELLGGVVQVQLDLVGRRGHRLAASELQLLDQVLVRDLGEAATLIRVEVDVVHVQRGRGQARGGHAALDHVVGGVVPAEVGQRVELEPHLHLVVLQGNQRQSKARVAAEPELQRHVQGVLRGTRGDIRRAVGLGARGGTRGIAGLGTLDQHVHEGGHVANHLGVAGLLARLLGQLVPDVHPVTVVLVDLLAANLNIHVVDQVVANPVEPAELGTRAVGGLQLHLGQSGLQVDAVDQVAVTRDGALHLLAEVRRAVESLLNRLHGEVRVATVDHLEEGDLGVASQVDILCTICDELH